MTNKKKMQKLFNASVSTALVASAITSVVMQENVSAKSFSDLTPSNSYYSDILELIEIGAINGMPDGTYRPNEIVTRGQAAKILSIVLDLNIENVKNPNFKDLSTDHPFYPHIAALVEAGVVNGYSNQNFGQNDQITRGQLAKMLARAYSLSPSNAETPFTDVSKNHEFYPYISALFESNITKGTTANTYDMNSAVTRGQFASFVMRAERNSSANSSAKTISGTIDSINNEQITIAGKTYSLSSDVNAIADQQNLNSLLQSKIEVTVKDNVVKAIKALELKEGSIAFDGKDVSITSLKAPSTLERLTAVKGDKIIVASNNSNLSIKNVVAKSITTDNTVAKTASLVTIANNSAAQFTFVDSVITSFSLGNSSASINTSNSKIENLNAQKVLQLNLTGSYNNVFLHSGVQLNGTATISNLIWGAALNNPSIAQTITFTSATIQEQTYTPNQITNLLQNNNNSSSTGGSGNTGDNSSSTDGSSNTKDKSGSTGGSGNTTPQTVELTSPTINNDGNLSVQDSTGKTQLYAIEDKNIASLLSNVQSDITNLEIIVADNKVQKIKALTATVGETGNFDGNNAPIEQLSLSGNVAAVSNITSDNLHVHTNAETVNFNNVEANTTVTGSYKNVEGLAGDSATFRPQTSFTANNVTSKNIVISEAPIAMNRMMRVASLNTASLFASQPTMTITFTGASTSGQTLELLRKDTVIDVQSSTPFSEIKISNSGNTITSKTPLMNVQLTNKVTDITLNANVEELSLNLSNKVQFSSSTSSTISKLKINNVTTENTDNWIALLNVSVTATEDISSTTPSDPTYIARVINNLNNPVSATEFNASLTQQSQFGYYKLNIPKSVTDALGTTGTYQIVQLSQGQAVPNSNDIAGIAQPYTPNTAFLLHAETTKVAVYTSDNRLAVINAPIRVTYTSSRNVTGSAITLSTTAKDTTSVNDLFGYFFIFNEGEVSYSKKDFNNSSWSKSGNYNTLTLSPVLNMDKQSEVFISKQGISYIHNNKSVVIEKYYPKMLKALAAFAKEKNDSTIIRSLIQSATAISETKFDSMLLDYYVNELTNPLNTFTTTAEINNMITSSLSSYNRDQSYTASDLGFNTAIKDQFEASNANIVTPNLYEGNLYFFPKEVGSTTLKVQDVDGNSSLINVTVEKVNGQNTVTKHEVLKTEYNDPNAPNQLKGELAYRTATIDGKSYILPTNLAAGYALLSPSEGNFDKVSLSSTNGVYTLTNKNLDIQPLDLNDLGLNAITNVTETATTGYLAADNKHYLYPISTNAYKEHITISNGTDATVVNVTATTTATEEKVIADTVKYTEAISYASTTDEFKSNFARATFANNKLTVYPLAAGNSTLKLPFGIVNISTTLTAENQFASNVDVPRITIPEAGITLSSTTLLKQDGDGSTGTTTYFVNDKGTAIALSASKFYTVMVNEVDGLYVPTVSAGKEFTKLTPDDFSTDGFTVAQDKSKLNGIELERFDDESLIIYATGTTGVSDILITDNTVSKVYHTTVENGVPSEPVVAEAAFTGDMVGATKVNGSNIYQEIDKLFPLAEGASSYIAASKRLINVDVTRNATTQYLQATPQYVIGTLKEVSPTEPTLTNFKVNGSQIYALNGIAEEKFLTPNYYVTAKTTLANNKYALSLDDRKMKAFDLASLGMDATIKVDSNTASDVASITVLDDKLVVYAGDNHGTTTLTVSDSQNVKQTYTVTHKTDGSFSVTQQLTFSSLDISTANGTITAEGYDSSTIGVVTDATGISIQPLKASTTAIKLVQNNKTIAILNIRVDSIDGNFVVTATPLTITTNDTRLDVKDHNILRKHSTKNEYFVVNEGTALFNTTEGAQKYVVTKNAATNLYESTATDHVLKEVLATEFDFTTIVNTSITNSNFAQAYVKSDSSSLYILGKQVGITDIQVFDGTNYATVVVNNTGDTTTSTAIVARQDITIPTVDAVTWTTNNIATIRTDSGGKNYIYSLETGNTSLTGTAKLNSVEFNILLNVNVTRNTDQSFKIKEDLVREATSTLGNITIQSGDSIKVVGDYIYAQKVGDTKILVDNSKLYTIKVTNINNQWDMDFEENYLISETFTPATLGMNSISDFTIQSINGDPIQPQKVGDNLVLFAQNLGNAEITFDDATEPFQTSIQAAVTNVNGALKITPTIYKAKNYSDAVTGIIGTLTTKTVGTATAVISSSKKDDTAVNNGAFKAGNAIYNVTTTKPVDGALSVSHEQVKLQPNELSDTTDLQFISGDEVINPATLDAIATTGTGAYRTTDGNYYSISISPENNHYKLSVTPLTKFLVDANLDEILYASKNISYNISNNEIYSTLSQDDLENTTVAIRKKDGLVYKGDLKDYLSLNTIDVTTDLLAELNWNSAASYTHNLTDSSIIKIEAGKFIVNGKATQTILFTGASGLSKELTITVADDYTFDVTSENNELKYSLQSTSIPTETSGSTIYSDTITLTFGSALNLGIIVDDGTTSTGNNSITLTMDSNLPSQEVNLILTIAELTTPITTTVTFTKIGDQWTATYSGVSGLDFILQ